MSNLREIKSPVAAGLKTENKPISANNHSANIERLLSRLEKCRPAGSGRWMACCSAHQDRSPSLSIRELDGKILIHCFAGCASSDVLAAVGLTWRDLFSDPWRGSYAEATSSAHKKLKPIDLAALDHRVIRLARDDIKAGRTLSAEDRARVELAIERLWGADND